MLSLSCPVSSLNTVLLKFAVMPALFAVVSHALEFGLFLYCCAAVSAAAICCATVASSPIWAGSMLTV